MQTYTLSKDAQQLVALNLVEMLESKTLEVEVMGNVGLDIKNIGQDVSIATIEVLKKSFAVRQFIYSHFEEVEGNEYIPSGLLVYDFSEGTVLNETCGLAIAVCLAGEVIQEYASQLTQEPSRFPTGKIIAIGKVKQAGEKWLVSETDDMYNLATVIQDLRHKDYLMFPSTLEKHEAVSEAKKYSNCIPVNTLEDAITPLLELAFLDLHSKSTPVCSEIETLLSEHEELIQKISEFEKRIAVYLESIMNQRETAERQLAFLEGGLATIEGAISQREFESEENLQDEVDRLLDSFDDFSSTRDEAVEVPEWLLIKNDDGIDWEDSEQKEIKKKARRLFKNFRDIVNSKDYSEQHFQNFLRFHCIWKEEDCLLLAAYVIRHQADHEKSTGSNEKSGFTRFDDEVEKFMHAHKVRLGLENRISNVKSSGIYKMVQFGEPWLKSVAVEANEEIDELNPRIEHLEMKIRRLSVDKDGNDQSANVIEL